MKEQIQKLRDEAAVLQEQAREKWKQIDTLYASCNHSWLQPVRKHRNISYDCGSHGGSYLHREWERECSLCGKVETTTRENTISVPDFESKHGKIDLSAIIRG